MEVLNVHERELEADPIQIGALIDSLASREDRLWPKHVWPRMEFDRSLGVGAKGGHGPIRYFVEEYTANQSNFVSLARKASMVFMITKS